MQAAALEAWDAGMTPIRTALDGSKRPFGSWKKYQSERPTRDEVAAWFADGHPGLSVVCGAVSRGLVLLEFEVEAVDAGIVDAFAEACDAAGLGGVFARIAHGWTDYSPTGAPHFHWRCSEPVGNLKLAFGPPDDDGKSLVWIETRGEGGQVVVAPSHGPVHPTGAAWERSLGGPASCATVTPEEQAALLDLARTFDHDYRSVTVDEEEPVYEELRSKSSGEWVADVVAEFNRRHEWADVIGSAFTFHHQADGVGYWKFNGQSGRWGATTNATGNDTLIVFSGTAAAHGWKTHTGNGPAPSYDKFSAHVFLATNTDDADARMSVARELRAEYFPEPEPMVAMASTPAPEFDDTMPTLPEAFWKERPHLEHIRDAAWSRLLAPDAALGAVLAWVCAWTDWRVVLPPLVARFGSLNTNTALVGISGMGKGSALDLADDLLGRPDIDGHLVKIAPAGSGEGMVHNYFDKVKDPDDGRRFIKEQAYQSVLIRVDEGALLTSLSERSGQTTLEIVRQAWSGELIGSSYSSDEKNVRLLPYSYRWSFIAAVQPTLAGPLLRDTAAGTAQRMTWWATIDPTTPDVQPSWPGTLMWEPARWNDGDTVTVKGHLRRLVDVHDDIAAEIRKQRLRAVRGDAKAAGHGTLAKLKSAALLASLDGRYEVNPDDWRLAGMIEETSTSLTVWMEQRTRVELQNEAAERGLVDAARRATTKAGEATIDRVAKWLAGVVAKDPGGTPGKYRRVVASRDRTAFDSALEVACSAGWVTTDSGNVLRPGPVKP